MNFVSPVNSFAQDMSLGYEKNVENAMITINLNAVIEKLYMPTT